MQRKGHPRIGKVRQYIDCLAKIPLVLLQHNQVKPLIQDAAFSPTNEVMTCEKLIQRNVIDDLAKRKTRIEERIEESVVKRYTGNSVLPGTQPTA